MLKKLSYGLETITTKENYILYKKMYIILFQKKKNEIIICKIPFLNKLEK